ncbi:MAG: hypothetical protein ACT4OM_05710 [Actinomycetota bacterium]
MTESIDKALSQIPGLKEKVAGRPAVPTAEDYFRTGGAGPESEESPFLAAKPKVDDSDAVLAALKGIPGLKERMGR